MTGLELQNNIKLQNPNSARWLMIQVDSICIEQPALRKLNAKSRKTEVYIHLFLPYKNSNSSKMTQWSIRLLSKNNQWTIPLLSHISLYTTELVFLYSYLLQWRKTTYSKKKNSKYKTGIDYNDENKLFKVQNRYQLQWRK